SSNYDFGNLSTPARTYTTIYPSGGGGGWGARNIWNRPAGTFVTNGSQTAWLGGASYDDTSGPCASALINVTGARLHDTATYGQTFIYRGNATSRSTPTESVCIQYDITGQVKGGSGTRGTFTTLSSVATNYAAPVAITANNYTTT